MMLKMKEWNINLRKMEKIDVLGHIWNVKINVESDLIHLSDVRCVSRENYTLCIGLYRDSQHSTDMASLSESIPPRISDAR